MNVLLPSGLGPEEERHGDVIPLLCSIFLANQGAGEAAGEGPVLSWVSKPFSLHVTLCNFHTQLTNLVF